MLLLTSRSASCSGEGVMLLQAAVLGTAMVALQILLQGLRCCACQILELHHDQAQFYLT